MPSTALREPSSTPRVRKALVRLLEVPPQCDQVTEYDQAHLVTYLKLLDAHAAGTDWMATVRIVLAIDPDADHKLARRMYESHLERAQWMTRVGYRDLL